MAIRPGRGNLNITGKIFALLCALAICPGAAVSETVAARNYHSFWLWAGVKPQPELKNADEIYLLAGEVNSRGGAHIIAQRSATPHLSNTKVWIVYRAQTLEWNDQIFAEILQHLETWRRAGNPVVGLQIDFDAGTKHLDRYAAFLTGIRARLPAPYRLGITGLLDWSANGDPQGLAALAGVIDEIVIQTYQGRFVIPGYETYLARLGPLKIPFKIGLVQGGDWHAPEGLGQHPFFEGYIVFLLNPRR